MRTVILWRQRRNDAAGEANVILNMHPAFVAPWSHHAVFRLDEALPAAPQVEAYLRALGDPRAVEEIILTTSSVAPLFIPAFAAFRRLPTLILFGHGEDVRVLGELDLDEYRHRIVRPQRAQIAHGDARGGVVVLDGAGRGCTPDQRQTLAAYGGCAEDAVRIYDVHMGHVDLTTPERGMVERLLALPVAHGDWVGGRIIFIPPGSGVVAAVMATAIHGLSESWPAVTRFRRGDDGAYRIIEFLDLTAMQAWASRYASELERAGAPVVVPRVLYDRLLATIHDDALRAELTTLTK